MPGGHRATVRSAAGQLHGNRARDHSYHLSLARPDQDDLDISITHKTHYYDGKQKIKRNKFKAGDRVSVD